MFELGSTAVLIWGVIFSSIGVGFFIYGKKQKAIMPLCVGVALCVFPYFIANVYLLVFVGLVLVVIPYFVRV
jgi:ABC-type Na+ efflux pump permease subunit